MTDQINETQPLPAISLLFPSDVALADRMQALAFNRGIPMQIPAGDRDAMARDLLEWVRGQVTINGATADEVTEKVRALEAHITNLQQHATAMEARLTSANSLVEAYRADWGRLDTLLQEEAESRNWCSEYETFAEKVNAQTTHLDLTMRENEYEVEWSATVTVEVSGTHTITARSADDAREQFDNLYTSDVIDTDDIVEAARYSGWDCDEVESGDVREA